jgi:carnitine-CoA ligase
MNLFGSDAPWPALCDLLDARASSDPDFAGLEVAGETFTLSEWCEKSDRLAAAFQSWGVKAGDRVATMLPNSSLQLLSWFASQKCGAIWAPINTGLIGDELGHALRIVDPKLIIADEVHGSDIKRIHLSDHVLLLTSSSDPKSELMAAMEAALSLRRAKLEPSDPATLIFTGGTTGMPKAALLPHYSYIAGTVRYRHFWAPEQGDVHFTTLHLFHAGCQYGAAMAPLAAGIKGVIEPRFSASTYWRRACDTGATLIDPLGTMLPFLTQQPPSSYDRSHRVRLCWFATAHLPRAQRDTFEQRFGVQLAPGTYGTSESGGNYLVSSRLEDRALPEGAIGKPWGWAELSIRDDQGSRLPPGQVGQVWLRETIPNTFMIGYWRDPERTREVWQDGWLRTGDLGRVDPEGYFWFEGRAAHWIRKGGENISAFEIESRLIGYPCVSEAVAIGVFAELGGEQEIMIFLIAEEGQTLDPADVHAWCTQRMAKFKVPRFITIVSDLPRSAAKREIERSRLQHWPRDQVWDAERRVMP